MTVIECLRDAPTVLTEGSLIERLRRDAKACLDPHVLNAALLYDEKGRTRLAALVRQYLDIGRECGLPMLIGTPTWRANPDRVRAAGLAGRDVNGDAARFVADVRASYGEYARHLLIGGLMGCRGDAYRASEGLSADDACAFHSPQARALSVAGVDFLLAATLPAVSEALGLARAMAACGCPYILSFVVRADGTCLDGTHMDEAVVRIDAEIDPAPTAYLANCVHPRIFAAALAATAARDPAACRRFVGLQANTSVLSPEELDNRAELDSTLPEAFAESMYKLHQQWGIRILGGCCGTDDRHIRAVAQRLQSS